MSSTDHFSDDPEQAGLRTRIAGARRRTPSGASQTT